MPASCWSRSTAFDPDRSLDTLAEVLLADLAAVSAAVASTRSRSEKIELLADTLGRVSSAEAPIAVSYLAGKPRQNRLGVGYATVYGVEVDPASDPSLEIVEVDEILESIAATSGPGSKQRRESHLADLLALATAD